MASVLVEISGESTKTLVFVMFNLYNHKLLIREFWELCSIAAESIQSFKQKSIA